jgi:hypothetical protein
MSAADRQKKARERRKNGLVCFRVEGNEDDVAKAMIRSERLSEGEALRHRRVERELGAIVADWVERWLRAPQGDFLEILLWAWSQASADEQQVFLRAIGARHA